MCVKTTEDLWVEGFLWFDFGLCKYYGLYLTLRNFISFINSHVFGQKRIYIVSLSKRDEENKDI